jgi:hypothetical protein
MENNPLSGVVHRFLPEKGANCLSMLQRAFDRYWNGADGRDGVAEGGLRQQGAAPHAWDASAALGHAVWLHTSGHAIWD